MQTNTKEAKFYVWMGWREKPKNIKKHGIDFNDAVYVFIDPNRIEIYDEKHSIDEDRYVTIGCIGNMFLIHLVYTMRGDNYRIISARMAENKERSDYYGRCDY